MSKLITPKNHETWANMHGGFVWHVDSSRKFMQRHPDLRERFDSKEMAMVCARQRIGEGYRDVTVCRVVATTIATDDD